MRAISLMVVLFVACLTACDGNETGEVTIVGKWKLTQTLMSNGGSSPVQWADIVNGSVIELKSDNSFINTQFGVCSSGTYTNLDGVITLDYSCGNTSIPNKFKMRSFTSDELILSNVNCIEECKDKYRKIANE
jgi:hypothetical protein